MTKLNSLRAFYVLQVDPDTRGETVREGSLLTPEGTTMADALNRVQWQIDGGSDPLRFVIATPDPDLMGVMTYYRENQKCVVLLHRGPFTEAAHAEHLSAIWGD